MCMYNILMENNIHTHKISIVMFVFHWRILTNSIFALIFCIDGGHSATLTNNFDWRISV